MFCFFTCVARRRRVVTTWAPSTQPPPYSPYMDMGASTLVARGGILTLSQTPLFLLIIPSEAYSAGSSFLVASGTALTLTPSSPTLIYRFPFLSVSCSRSSFSPRTNESPPISAHYLTAVQNTFP